MTAHFESVQNAAMYPDAFDVVAPDMCLERDLWPRKLGVFVRNASAAEGAAPDALTDEKALTAPVRELGIGQFGFVPQWVKSASDAKLRSTKLAVTRYETMSTATPTRETWLRAQRCIIPMQAFFEDDWRSRKAVSTRIARVDGKPMGVAGLWECWKQGDQEIVSYTLLTVNANSHALMNRYGQNGNEKRMPAILNEGAWNAWLTAPLDKAREFMRAYPANLLLANPVQKKA
jgi:putative SOS response-associated peptidase YedK